MKTNKTRKAQRPTAAWKLRGAGARGAKTPAVAAHSDAAKGASMEGLVDMAEAIGLLKTTRPTFYRWLRSGKLKGMKVGRQWRFYRADIERFLKGEGPRIELPGDLTPLVATLRGCLAGTGKTVAADADESPDAAAVSLMIAAGFHLHASDLHLEPQTKPGGGTVAVLRCRVDGVLHLLAEFDLRLLRPLVERWKIMASADIHENRKPQDGRIILGIEGRQIDLRVCFLPVSLGEALTVRFLDPAAVQFSLERLPYAPADRERLVGFLDSPWGMLVVTGPTGCGKTTALYACINHCAKPGLKVMSVEDPVEYLLPWVTQVQIRPAAGLTFPAALRALLRSDPDVIMIGELRDQESLMVAQQSALTGHLVMTTLHAEDAASALKRMVDMGSDPFIVADATKLVLSQRLVRQLCPHCSKEIPAAPASVRLERARDLATRGGLEWAALPLKLRQPVGCEQCRKTGYRGRSVIAETLDVTPAIGLALRNGASVEELRALAVKQGMTTFAADGIRRAGAGQTTLDEVFRVVGLP